MGFHPGTIAKAISSKSKYTTSSVDSCLWCWPTNMTPIAAIGLLLAISLCFSSCVPYCVLRNHASCCRKLGKSRQRLLDFLVFDYSVCSLCYDSSFLYYVYSPIFLCLVLYFKPSHDFTCLRRLDSNIVWDMSTPFHLWLTTHVSLVYV